ncbi:hypothetical protein LXT21_26005 [Myxococcus sp. K38C18041901]|uniref:hypothetical protein n=1 Tax=Myxococcus guangdongensis TaxID=2906760 RepID=UPI0020A6EDB2|nr:hypothetical protein [Myxococcus guangdongensis]MCP3062248.1 hypothetical protein [Myxococcus guangdongensis]
MSRSAIFLIVLVSFIAGGVSCAVGQELVLDIAYGPVQSVVLEQDIALGFGNSEGTSCPGTPAGGVFAGTPLVVRGRGAIKLVTLRFSYAGKDLPTLAGGQTPPAGMNGIHCVNPAASDSDPRWDHL